MAARSPRAGAGRRFLRFGAAGFALALLGAHAAPPRQGAVVISGTLQTAPAYASAAANSYTSAFPQALVVHIVGKSVNSHRVRFTCGMPHCTLGVPTEPLQGTRVDPRTYEVQAVNRQAALTITLSNDFPGSAIVWAYPVGYESEKTAPAAFVLTLR